MPSLPKTGAGRFSFGLFFEDRLQAPIRSAYLSLGVDSIDEAERIYTLLSDGGQIFMPMEETFFAYRFSMLRDRFGTSWMVINQKPM